MQNVVQITIQLCTINYNTSGNVEIQILELYPILLRVKLHLMKFAFIY